MTKFVNNDLNLDFNKAEAKVGKKTASGRMDSILDKDKQQRLFKTLMVAKEMQSKLEGDIQGVEGIDNDDYLSMNHNRGETNSATAPLDRRIQVLKGNIQQLREIYETNERNYSLQNIDCMTKMDSLHEQAIKSEKLACELTKEILKQRIQFEQYEFELQNENERMRRANVSQANALADLECVLDIERKDLERNLEKEVNTQTAGFKEKCRKREEETDKLKLKYKELQQGHFEKVRALESELRSMRNR
jgi:hypothetical protein